ncbi:hypothetical protein Pcinc_037701 [Petrolisthes cinctipes]|uniref:Uncharacterized protein n=1 Tax=Petrolisthes cinctipes TaxID=88211 RepID=A0AAE1BTI2_PETCI|nr:hypothetical protein Pcinc_037701 [Petrolisthes cinctipes]
MKQGDPQQVNQVDSSWQQVKQGSGRRGKDTACETVSRKCRLTSSRKIKLYKGKKEDRRWDRDTKPSFPTSIFPWSPIPKTQGEYSDLGLQVEYKILLILNAHASFSVLPSLSHQHYLFYLFIRLGPATPPGSRPDTIRTKANTGGASAPYPGPGLLQRPADHYNPTPSHAEENQQSPREEREQFGDRK